MSSQLHGISWGVGSGLTGGSSPFRLATIKPKYRSPLMYGTSPLPLACRRPAGSLGATSARSGLVTSTSRTCNDAPAFASSAVSSAENAENLAALALAYSSAPNRMYTLAGGFGGVLFFTGATCFAALARLAAGLAGLA